MHVVSEIGTIRTSREALIADLGLHRVECVRVTVGSGRAIAEVTGVAHRYPRTFRISLSSAARLAAAGLPLRIEHRDDSRGRTEVG